MSKLSIHARNVSKSFRTEAEEVHALKEVNFDACYGELLMIFGPSGCGKTTLLSIIAGTLYFDSGKIEVMGMSLGDMDDDQLCHFRRQNIGFIFQQYHLIPTLTVEENISIPLILNGIHYNQAKKIGKKILADVGLEGRRKDFPRNLSSGEQQRVAIARALIHNPKIVICDEPTSALDFENGAKIMEILTKVVLNPERTVILVTHDQRIFKFANRIAKMDDGKITAILT